MKMRAYALTLSTLGLLLLATGCGGRKEISETARKEAAHLSAEADFAQTVRDFPRAEALLVKAVELAPDSGPAWINLGAVRRRMGNRDGARSAYKSALDVYEEAVDRDENNAEAWLQQVYVLALLGEVDDARKLVDKMARRFPNNGNVRGFVEQKQLDSLLADQRFKDMAL